MTLRDAFGKRFQCKFTVAHDKHDNSELKMLNRSIRFVRGGVEYEGDRRHAKTVIQMLHLEDVKAVHTPHVGKASTQEVDRGEFLSPDEMTKYRSCVAIINFIGMDRPDIQEAAR